MLSVDLVILDFDGVLTDNRVYVFQDGREAVVCHRGDGWGIQLLRAAQIELLILSTETNPVVSERAKKMNIDCLQGCRDKAETVAQLISDRGLDPNRIVYVGNDTNDIQAMELVGHRVAPADAHVTVRSMATLVTVARGGEGVVRELADVILGDELTRQ